MEQKTKIHAENNRQEIVITRDFDLPVSLLFKAYIEPEIIEQWMGTKVVKFDCKKHGAYIFETKDPKGNLLLKSSGVIHDIITNKIIIRTFEMVNTSFPVQLEYLDFEEISSIKSRLIMKVIYKSINDRDEILKLPFAFGINMAHNKLESLLQTN